MAGSESQKRQENMALDFFHFVFLLHSLHRYATPVDAVESHSQAFIQTDNHLTYIVGDGIGMPVELKPGHPYSELGIHEENILPSGVRLDPPMLDFGEHPVGMPHLEQVTVQNTDTKNSLHLLSISGSTAHFHCSFFQDKMVPPGGNTTFDVIFLARQVGNVENTLYIHTTQGSFKYQVFGVGIPNPYRLRPYLGAKVPLNSSFSPLIRMHNPHSSTLQVVEMFSSGGDLHLELPTGEKEAARAMWEIPPYETKPVMRANFVGRVETNHTAFIRIKTNQERYRGLLILPLEVEVTSVPGIYSPVEMIDFGILRTLDDPQTVQLNLINTGSRPVHITAVTLSPPNDAVSVEFRPIKLQPDLVRHTTVAHITFRATKALHPRQWFGRIIVKSKNTQNKLTIPYQVNVLHGSLVYNTNSTHYFSGSFVRNFTSLLSFTNTFNFSIVIYNVTLPPTAHQYFTIVNFTKPVIISPQETLVPFLIKFHPNTTQIHFTSQLIIQTNASSFNIPLIIYNGLLKVIHHRPEKFKGQLDFGTMGIGEQRSMIFTIRNDNPVNIVIGEFGCNMNRTLMQLLGIERGNGTSLTKAHNASEIDTDPLVLKPYHFAVFSVNITAPAFEGAFAGEVLTVTQFQDLYIPVTLRTAEGSLNAIPEKLIFDKVYPGKTPYKVLQIHSTFEDYMKVTQVSFRPVDSRFYYRPPAEGQVILEPRKYTRIGKIYFDAKRACREDCYVGLPTFTPGHQWLLGLGLDKEVADTDQYLYTRLWQKWERVEKMDQSTINVTIEVDTNQVRGFLFSAQAHLHWPSLLVKKCKIKFPLTQIGNMSISDFIVENPGDVPVLIQVLSLPLYPNPQTIIDLMSLRLAADLSDYIETDDMDIFILPDVDKNSGMSNSQNSSPSSQRLIENILGIKPHKHTLTTMLNSGTKVKFRVGFQPKDDLPRTSLVIIRNNLTIIESLVVQGQGGQGEMRFSNRKTGSHSPLLFEMTEKHLKNCDKKQKNRNAGPNFTVKRMFTMRNTGELPFYVHGFNINDSPCEGYGFKVMLCHGFELPPNGSQKIDIAFTPDFTMSRIRRVLTIVTSLGPPMNYTLQATVPPHMLSKCSAVLPRPSWEPLLYYIIICVMGFLVLCVLIMAYFEADRIFVADILKRKLKVSSSSSTQTAEKGKVFDLKNVAGLTVVQRPASLASSAVSFSSSLLSPELQSVSRPVLELANGHVEQKRKQERSWIPSLFTLLSGFLSSSKNVHLEKKSNISRTNSREKEAVKALHVPNNVKTSTCETEKQQSLLQESTLITEKASAMQRNSRKSKGAKRYHNDLNSVESTGQYTFFEKRPSVEEAPVSVHARKHVNENTHKEMNLHETTNKTSVGKRSEKTNGDDKRLWTTETKNDNCLLVLKQENTNTVKGRPKRRKSRLDKDFTKRIAKDITDEKDETSSTTTESSGGDAEEKHNLQIQESTPNPTPVKAKKSKSKSVEKYCPPVEDIGGLDDDFELTTKSRAHKKIKVNPKDAYGGNILRPSTLELPYNMEPKKPVDTTGKEPNITETSTTKQKKNKSNRNAPKGEISTLLDTDESCKVKDSATPLWDLPIAGPPVGDFSELALQTENFAQKHIRTLNQSPPQTNGYISETLSGSSRSSSYSSVVSSSSETPGNKTKVLNPDTKQPSSNFNPFGDNGLPGAFVPRNIAAAKIQPVKPNNVWSNASGPETLTTSFNLPSIQEAAVHPTGLENTGLESDFGFSTNDSLYGFNCGFDKPQTSTMMKRLLAERRMRQLEHRLRVMKEDWPGFDVRPVTSESLWDPNYSPIDQTWSTAPDTAPTSSNGLWNSLTCAANRWNSLPPFTQIWSNSSPISDNFCGESFSDPSTENSGSSSNHGNQEASPAATFDPFTSLAHIWGPTRPAEYSPTGWGFSQSNSDAAEK